MFDNLRKDKLTNCSPINLAGLKALRVYRFGRWRMTIKNRILRAPLSFLYQQLEKHIRFKYGIELPYTAVLGDRVRFEHQHGIVIHGNAYIGNDCIIRQGVTIGNKNISEPYDAPRIGDNVNIGAGAKILGAISIGNNVTIGANSVVTKDLPDNTIAVGIPAKIIKPTKN